MKDKLDNEILPISGYLKIDIPDLIIAMEALSEEIENHFKWFELSSKLQKTKTAL